MKERPIIFSGEMVRAILDGRKTQTRRVIMHSIMRGLRVPYEGGWILKPHPGGGWYASETDREPLGGCGFDCPHGAPGDRLWVRESFYPTTARNFERGQVVYKADTLEASIEGKPLKWNPSIHMPRWASRIFLEIVNVRVERLQEINEQDAVAEGTAVVYMQQHRETFQQLWDSINAKRAPWSSNPWVWVIEFKKVQPA